MDNYIDFYSIPYNKDSFNQPYFKTSESRDSFFAQYTPLRVNALGVNINLKYDYQFELKVNVDVVNMDVYNFAILNYNSKKFYCNIDDYEQISVNRSRVKLTRNPVFEVIDFFQYFTNLLVERDGSNYLDYTKNSSNVSIYKGRYYPTRYKPSFRYYWNNSPVDVIETDVYIIFASGFQSDTLHATDAAFDGEFDVSFMENANGKFSTNGAVKNYYCFIVLRDDMNPDLLDAISPYLISIHYCYFPIITTTSVPFVDKSAHCYLRWKNTKSTGQNVYKFINAYNVYAANSQSTYFTFFINFSSDECFNKLECCIYSLSNKIELNYKDFVKDSNGNGVLNIQFRYIISQNRISIYMYYFSTSDLAPIGNNNTTFASMIPLISGFDYVTDESARWASENRYYDELTNNAVSLRSAKGWVQAAENVAAGAAQLTRGASVMGVSNLIRGAFEPIHAIVDNEYYKEERDLLEAQARSAPDTFNNASDSVAFYNELMFLMYFNILTPFSSDFNRFKQDLLKYGTYVNKCIDTVDTSSDFILKAVAQRNTSALPDMQYNKLYEYVRAGHKYIIGG